MPFKLVGLVLHHDLYRRKLRLSKRKADEECFGSRKTEEQMDAGWKEAKVTQNALTRLSAPVAVSVTNHFIPSNRASNLIYFRIVAVCWQTLPRNYQGSVSHSYRLKHIHEDRQGTLQDDELRSRRSRQ